MRGAVGGGGSRMDLRKKMVKVDNLVPGCMDIKCDAIEYETKTKLYGTRRSLIWWVVPSFVWIIISTFLT
jgi:hypothetical protein